MAKKILVVEDHPETSEMICNILKMSGFETISAPDGLSGLQKSKTEKPDLILLDIMMPEMSGFEVCDIIKKAKETSTIPIVFVSVRASEDSVKKGKKLGADAYMSKPFDPFKLVELVKNLLK